MRSTSGLLTLGLGILRLGTLGLSLLAAPAAAQNCDCDHELGTEVTGFDGLESGVEPGDRICVMAGEREFLRFQHIEGTAQAPVTILNCGGRAVIHNEDRAYALVFEDGSHHFRVTGTGDDAHEYGFDISCPATTPYPGVGLWLLGRSTDYEADHLEIHDTGFAGVSAKTDPLCDGSADQGVFVQRNTSLHHLYIHDTGGEGFYIGSTQSDGQTIQCDGSPEVHQPHYLEGVEVYSNVIEDTGWDGAQIGMARVGCRFTGNIIRRVGLAGEQYQMQGLQLGTFSACEVSGNVIEDGPAMGIIVLGAGETFIHSNAIARFANNGVYANQRDVAATEGVGYRIAFNTIEGTAEAGVRVFGSMLGASSAHGNLLVATGGGVEAGGDVDWTDSGNVIVAAREEAGFVGAGDWHIREDSPARGAATALAGVERDLEGYPRADPPAAGAYEYRDPTVDAGAVPGRRDAGPGGSGGGDCSCRAGARSDAPLGLLLGALAAVLWRRRR